MSDVTPSQGNSRKRKREDEVERKIIVSINFGESSDKVPTKLRYREVKAGSSDGSDIQWGFEIPVTAPANEVIEWFKLEVDAPSNTHQYGQHSKAAGKSNTGNLDAVSVVSDYLRGLSDHLKYILCRKLGEGVVGSMPIDFVVTVPAMWTDLAKDKTRIACMKAFESFGKNKVVQLVSEPEAGAIFSLRSLDPHGLKVDDTIIVVDAGGGTVDLISYTISQLEPSLKLAEAAPGQGGLCGSSFLNKGFAELLETKLGGKRAFDAELPSEAMDVCEKKQEGSCQHATMTHLFLHLSARTYPLQVSSLTNLLSRVSSIPNILQPRLKSVMSLQIQISDNGFPVAFLVIVPAIVGVFHTSSHLNAPPETKLYFRDMALVATSIILTNILLAVAFYALDKEDAIISTVYSTMITVQSTVAVIWALAVAWLTCPAIRRTEVRVKS